MNGKGFKRREKVKEINQQKNSKTYNLLGKQVAWLTRLFPILKKKKKSSIMRKCISNKWDEG
jgi:hypothetical protein